jgi:flagellar biosynthesis chaperone FliJ
MKYKLLFLLLIAAILGCQNKNSQSSGEAKYTQNQLQSLKKENKQLKEEAEKKEESLDQFMQAFNDINRNLQIIKEKEDIISMTATEMPGGVSSQKIQDDIMLIYDLLQENKETVKKLRDTLEASNMLNENMKRSLEILSTTVERKNKEISRLRQKLENRNTEMQMLNTTIDSLMAENEEKNRTIEAQKTLLNTAYLAIGTSDELFKEGVTTRAGGIIGVGSINRFDDYFEQDAFKAIKIDKTREIQLKAKKAKLLSTHPSTAYKFYAPDGNPQKLIITRPEQFWSTSRYLVIEVSY